MNTDNLTQTIRIKTRSVVLSGKLSGSVRPGLRVL